MWRKSILLLVLMTILLFTGCKSSTIEKQEINHTYKGESENWMGVYEENKTLFITKESEDNKYISDTLSKNTITLTYKGDSSKIDPTKIINYSYKTGSNGGHEDTEFKKVITRQWESHVNSIKTHENIMVTITIDEESEMIRLEPFESSERY